MPPEQPTPPSSLKQIRTFQGDIAQALSNQHESLYSLQAKEHARGGTVQDAPAQRSVLLFLFGALLLLALGSVGAWLAYREFLVKTTPPPPAIPASQFLSAENVIPVDIAAESRDALLASLLSAASNTPTGELRHLNLLQGTTTEKTADFFAALGAQAPDSLVRALEPVFMAGAYGDSHFLIFKLNSFGGAFAGMLAWEKSMYSDIGPFFGGEGADLQQTGSASVFKDVVYKNKDARALFATSSPEASPVLLYSFFDNRMLIITDRPETLTTLIDRLTRDSLAR